VKRRKKQNWRLGIALDLCYLCDSCHSHGSTGESRVPVRAVALSFFPFAPTGMMSLFVIIPHTLQKNFALLHNLVWTCACLGSALLCFMFGLADSFPCCAPTHYDEILLQQTLPPLIYYLPMSNTVKIIRAVSVLVHNGLTDSTL